MLAKAGTALFALLQLVGALAKLANSRQAKQAGRFELMTVVLQSITRDIENAQTSEIDFLASLRIDPNELRKSDAFERKTNHIRDVPRPK